MVNVRFLKTNKLFVNTLVENKLIRADFKIFSASLNLFLKPVNDVESGGLSIRKKRCKNKIESVSVEVSFLKYFE